MKQTLEEIVNTFNSFITDKEKGILWDSDKTYNDLPYKERYRRVNYFIGQLISETNEYTSDTCIPDGCPELPRSIKEETTNRQYIKLWAFNTVDNQLDYVTIVWDNQSASASKNRIFIRFIDDDFADESIMFRDIKNLEVRQEAVAFITDWLKHNPGKTLAVAKGNFRSWDDFGYMLAVELRSKNLFGFVGGAHADFKELSNGAKLWYNDSYKHPVTPDMAVYIGTEEEVKSDEKLIRSFGENCKIFTAQ